MNQTNHAGRPPIRYRLRRRIQRHRRLIACLLLSAAAGVAVEAAVGEDYATTTVVSAAHDLPVGKVLSDADVALIDLPEQAMGGPAYQDRSQVVGQQLAAPLSQGSPIPPTALVGDGLLTGTAPGTVAVPIRPADPATVQLLAPGQIVDVILSTGNGYDVASESTVLARSVPVVWAAPGGSGGTWPGADDDAGLVVVAAGAEEAAALAGASSSGDVHLVLRTAP
ncbi:flagellar biosynthesis protein FlgA [Arthrobacter sp. NamB2]|uniref:RcpC/CpaB family pilus assembly protein n=1 Tax=Arthrobacter sp. NamB2 TaxID=2576035 RepID=UPI0010C9E5BC|nr:RcpC/CpaB family pilus assembly protein [Arthrobacter sp. NamB2]TKV29584.1 flagellar biosynthesis protein FlgA [Arthrobacter sp. NamB2]